MKIYYDYQIFMIRQYGGVSRYFVELASLLSRYDDVRVKIVAPLFRSQFLSEQRSHISTIGMDLSAFPKLPPVTLRSINALLFERYAAIAAADIVHETYYAPARTAPKSAKIVTTIHDTIPELFPQFFPGSKQHRAEKEQVLRRADRIICVSESTRDDLLKLYEVDPSRVSVVLLGSSLEPAKGAPMNIGAPYFLHVGSRYPYKNFDSLIQALGATNLHRTHKLVSFTAMPLCAREISAMARAGVPQSSVVRVGGDDSVLARYYAGAEALAFPSFYEGFGIPLLEAMRCGCPIITSNTSSLPEVAGDAAIYFDPTDVKAISDAMIRIASSKETRDSLIARGQARAQSFTWERCAAQTYAVYSDLLKHQ